MPISVRNIRECRRSLVVVVVARQRCRRAVLESKRSDTKHNAMCDGYGLPAFDPVVYT